MTPLDFPRFSGNLGVGPLGLPVDLLVSLCGSPSLAFLFPLTGMGALTGRWHLRFSKQHVFCLHLFIARLAFRPAGTVEGQNTAPPWGPP